LDVHLGQNTMCETRGNIAVPSGISKSPRGGKKKDWGQRRNFFKWAGVIENQKGEQSKFSPGTLTQNKKERIKSN